MIDTVTNSIHTDSNNSISSHIKSESTLERGPLLGILRPVWLNTTESEERLHWFRQMIGRDLLVRDVGYFLHNTCDKLRSGESRVREEESEVLKLIRNDKS